MTTRGGLPGVPVGLDPDRMGWVNVDSEEHCLDGYLAAPGAGTTASGARSPAESAQVRQPRILIIDDEPMIGTTLKVLLSDDNDVLLADSGEKARELLGRESFDLVLCDLMMPGLSGMELHQWLAEQSPGDAARMVFMTGGVFTDAARDFLEKVPNRRIEKPFDTRDLLQLIDEELQREHADGQPSGR